jgi:hypothetical protein
MNDARVHEYLMQNHSYKERKACMWKTKFPSKRNAMARARLIGGTMNSYKCKICGSHHLGHSEPRRVPVAS